MKAGHKQHYVHIRIVGVTCEFVILNGAFRCDRQFFEYTMQIRNACPDNAWLDNLRRTCSLDESDILMEDGVQCPCGSTVVIPVVTFLTPLAEYSSDLKDRKKMLSQFVFALTIRFQQAFPLLVHMRFLFLLSSP